MTDKKRHPRLLYQQPMRSFTGRLPENVIAFYEAKGGGNVSRGIRTVAEDALRLMEVVPQSSRVE